MIRNCITGLIRRCTSNTLLVWTTWAVWTARYALKSRVWTRPTSFQVRVSIFTLQVLIAFAWLTSRAIEDSDTWSQGALQADRTPVDRMLCQYVIVKSNVLIPNMPSLRLSKSGMGVWPRDPGSALDFVISSFPVEREVLGGVGLCFVFID